MGLGSMVTLEFKQPYLYFDLEYLIWFCLKSNISFFCSPPHEVRKGKYWIRHHLSVCPFASNTQYTKTGLQQEDSPDRPISNYDHNRRTVRTMPTGITQKVFVRICSSMYHAPGVAHFAKITILLSMWGTLELHVHWFRPLNFVRGGGGVGGLDGA